ncbi:DUF4123 domain-containing protein [Pseudomonas schmalbachii]|uniref:DUF4123 domain-containing protein n=1 Tax=Pseudomonas schmalbachii TaxID=2816993 RepID=A0ABS3TM68_9PSED|nr:DUF4123 domain-containing protein [Pseudomonas schmalbachii]MBO3274762.1 DUF4123 domain-containing protein [Pseudomonas schmalbachii]
MSAPVHEWLREQAARHRELLLVIDSLAEPNPIQELFRADLMQDYINLYGNSEFADLADVGPWLIRIGNANAEAIQALLQEPQRNWGWLASIEHFDMQALEQHWRERLVIGSAGQRSLYRFQDNRVIARHLLALTPDERAVLLGPLTSVLGWDGQAWQRIENPHPSLYPAPVPAPWWSLPEPQPVAESIQRHNLTLWLWENHAEPLASLLQTRDFDGWMDEQLARAREWQWHADEEMQFLLRSALNLELARHPGWQPISGETPDQHFRRCLNSFKGDVQS